MRWLTLVVAFVVVLTGPPAPGAQEGEIHFLVIEGVINPFTERYLADALRAAEQAGAAGVVVRLNTPGGLERSMRAMMPDVRVSPWLIALATTAVASFFPLVVRALVAVYRRPATTGIEALIGRTGVAVSDLAPGGTVRVDTEVWRAVAEGGRVREGEEVEVTRVEGVTLRVRPRPAARIERRAA